MSHLGHGQEGQLNTVVWSDKLLSLGSKPERGTVAAHTARPDVGCQALTESAKHSRMPDLSECLGLSADSWRGRTLTTL